MRVLYLNNIRGFTKTYIPICQVNFFVGENSTGKSSILSLVKLMSKARFWSHDEFNIEEVVLGFFDELVNNNSDNKNSFEIGYLNSSQLDNNFHTCVLAKYVNHSGEPKLSELRLLSDNNSILLKFAENNLFIKIKPFKVSSDDNKDELNEFKRWIRDDNFDKEIFAKEKFEEEDGRRSFYDIKQAIVKQPAYLINKKKFRFSNLSFIPIVTWIAPIRTKPKRLYESFKRTYSPEGSHTPLLIKNILSNNFKKTVTKGQFSAAIQKFGRKSNLFDKIEIENLGNDSTAPFIIHIYLGKIPLKITNVGYGIGQVLPLLTEILVSQKAKWFSIQQPEVHLHPKAQAALGEFLYSAALHKKQNFLIETHSDFIIDRYRLCLNKNKKKVDSQVLFFERRGNKNTVTPVKITSEGQYEEKQPKSFRNFFLKEQLELIKI